MVGVDLTQAIDAAYENIGGRPNVHLVQADIFAMPFRDGTFDLAYSVGVLHHTPDPAAAFARVAAAVRHGRGPRRVPLCALRAGPPRLGHDPRAHHAAAAPRPAGAERACRPAYYLYRVPLLGRALGVMLPISLHRDWRWRWLDTFDWYSPRYQWKLLYPEVARWFRTNGFRDVELFDGPIRMRGVKTEEPS